MLFNDKGAILRPRSLHSPARTTHISITGSPRPRSVDRATGADPSSSSITKDGFLQTSPHRAMKRWRSVTFSRNHHAAANKDKREGFERFEVMAPTAI